MKLNQSPADPAQPLLEVGGVTIQYKTPDHLVTATYRVDFNVFKSDRFVILGPSGAGKSTLLRALAGLLRPQSGSIVLRGTNEPDQPGISAHYIGHADAMKATLSAQENLVFWAAMLGGETGASPAEALAAFGLAHVLHLPVGYLSAGQKRRVALARLLVAPRPLWLLDEPTLGLDVASVARFGDMLAKHRAEGGIVLAATHLPLPLPGAKELRLS